MSFGGQSNAWQSGMMQDHHQQNSFHPGPPQMFMQTPQQNNMASYGHGVGGGGGGGVGGMYMNTGGGGHIAYPQARSGLNPAAFPGSGNGGGVGLAQSQYNSIGTVTKINNDCGLVNNEVFFYRNVCKGPEPKLGDRVLFEATCSNNGQFKWNASRIQLMQTMSQQMINSSKSSYSAVPPPNEYQRSQMMHRHMSPKRMSPGIRQERDRHDHERDGVRHHHSRGRDEEEWDRKRRREDRERSREHDPINPNPRYRALTVGTTSRAERERDSRRGGEVADRERERERDRGRVRERERERGREKDKERTREHTSRDVENHRSIVPNVRRGRTIRRYAVQIPKSLLPHKYADVQEIHNRYTTLYTPSDFFYANIKWPDTFTPDNQFSLRRPCQFCMKLPMVDPPFEQKMEDLDPPDADYVYSAKVMLMALSPIAEIYKKTFENSEDEFDHHASHPSKHIRFLVGVRGHNEPMAIGGPWSPSLDGENPDTDPSVLIRTAIRTCKALTGVDLSNCSQWYRFVELYYHRTEYKNMEKDGPPRVETVVIYLPDVHSCMPTPKEYETVVDLYKTTAENLIASRSAAFNGKALSADVENNNGDTSAESIANADDENDNEGAGEGDGDEECDDEEAANVDAEENEVVDEGEGENDGIENKAEENGCDTEEVEDNAETVNAENDNQANQNEESVDEPTAHSADAGDHDSAEIEGEDENDIQNAGPTHYSLLDLKSMKLQEIRDELLARELSDKGVRNVVMARLAKAINMEKAEEIKARYKKNLNKITNSDKSGITQEKQAKGNTEEIDFWADVSEAELNDMVVLDEYDASQNAEDTKLNKRERNRIKLSYKLPKDPHIIVHPNKFAKGGNFHCAVMSLSVLLDYHPEDTKERCFEVFLFAELFNEMLMRDFGFTIYKEIYLYKGAKSNDVEQVAADGDTAEIEGSKDTNGDEKPSKDNQETKSEGNEQNSSKIRKRRMSTIDGEVTETGDCKKPSPKRRMSTVDGRVAELSTSDDKKVIPSKPQRRMSIAEGREAELLDSHNTSKKTVVVKPELLLSFLYFDSTQCGYIFQRDLEDLFTVLGLQLSRSQIKKVLGKLGTKTSVYYRKLTDREETTETPPSIEDIDDLPIEELRNIAAGNNKYEFVFGESQNANRAIPIDADDKNEADLVNYNGTVIHVGKLVEQIKRTERSHSDLEKLHKDLQKKHADLQKDHTKSYSKVKDLQSEVKSLLQKSIDCNRDLHSLNRKYKDQNATLSYIYTRVAPYFIRDKEKEKEKEKDKEKEREREKEKEKVKDKGKEKEKAKEKEKDSKTESSHDKEKAEKDKDKEKSKHKEKISEKENDKKTSQTVKEGHKEEKDNMNKEKHHKETESKESMDVNASAEKEKRVEKEKTEVEKPKVVTSKASEPVLPKGEAENTNEVPAMAEQVLAKGETEKVKDVATKPVQESKIKVKEETAKARVNTPVNPKETVAKAVVVAKASPVKPKVTPVKAVPVKPTLGKPVVAKGTPARTTVGAVTKATPAKVVSPNAARKPTVTVAKKVVVTESANKK